jgi:hypothetical protein
METQELFELRKKQVISFNSPKDLVAFLDRLMVQDVGLPMVVGYERFSETDWKVVTLMPRQIHDKLTVLNYLAGLGRVCEELATREPLVFKGGVVYNGIDTRDRSNQNHLVLDIHIGAGHPAQTAGGYSLSRSFELDLFNYGNTYYARTEIKKPKIDEIMEPYIGPK